MQQNDSKYLKWSLAAHAAILLLLMLNFYLAAPTPVFENTHKNDVISAVVLGDTAKSKILPQKKPAPKLEPKPIKDVVKEAPKPTPPPVPQKTKVVQQEQAKPDVIAIKKEDNKKKLAEKKKLEEKQLHDKLAQDFLADLEKMKVKKLPKKKVAVAAKKESSFEKLLREQAEKSLREQLLNEEIKLQGQQSRQSQGEVNKYKALIIQAISENWIVPPQANKKLYCELMIRVAPGGMVLDVKVTKTSGDPSLDASARAAVLKSSPLPVPKDSDAFESFRQFVLKVKPENIIQA